VTFLLFFVEKLGGVKFSGWKTTERIMRKVIGHLELPFD